MYKFDDGQLSIDEFEQPVGMHLTNSNRWVKKARLIPWTEIEKRYAKLFCNRNGNVAKPLRLALGACLIPGEYGYSGDQNSGTLIVDATCAPHKSNILKIPICEMKLVNPRKNLLIPSTLKELKNLAPTAKNPIKYIWDLPKYANHHTVKFVSR